MSDPREAILQRLLALAGEIEGINRTARNVPVIEEGAGQLPALVLLDGDEEASDADPTNRPSWSKRRIEMMPDLLLAVGATPATVGADLNTLRARIIAAVVTDAALQALVLDRTGIRYDGMIAPRDELGRMVISQRALRFTLTYVLDPMTLSLS